MPILSPEQFELQKLEQQALAALDQSLGVAPKKEVKLNTQAPKKDRTKIGLYKEFTKDLNKLIVNYNLPENITNALQELVIKHLKPYPKGGNRRNLDVEAVTIYDKEGNLTHLKCSMSGYFLPATGTFFRPHPYGRKDLGGFSRTSKLAYNISRRFRQDLVKLEAEIHNSQDTLDIKELRLREVRNMQPDFSSIAQYSEFGKEKPKS